MLLLALAAALAAEPVTAVQPLPSPLPIVGTWNVTSTQTRTATCDKTDPGSIAAYIWIVGVDSTGNIEVSVQGKTAYPKLTGSMRSDGGIRLEGNGESTSVLEGLSTAATSWFDLHFDGADLVGTRRLLLVEEWPTSASSQTLLPCFIDFDVRAKR